MTAPITQTFGDIVWCSLILGGGGGGGGGWWGGGGGGSVGGIGMAGRRVCRPCIVWAVCLMAD